VALVLGQHVPDTVPELVAAALLHDCPGYVPKYIDLDATLTTSPPCRTDPDRIPRLPLMRQERGTGRCRVQAE